MAPSSDLERPEKILVACAGTRGDVQPYIAVVKALQAAGYANSLLGTNTNHEAIVTECGVPYRALFGDCERFIRENEALSKSMAQGSTLKFVKGLGDAMESYAELHATTVNEVIQEFQPDLIIVGGLVEAVGYMGLFHYRVPTFFLFPSHCPPNPQRMVFGLPNLPFKLNSWVMQEVLIEGVWTGLKRSDELGHHIAGYKVTELMTKQLMIDEADCPNIFPRLLMMGREWLDVVFPGCNAALMTVGQAVLPAEFQEEVGSAQSPTSFGDAAGLQRMRDFLAGGKDKPICMGWGSMTCKSPEYMVKLVTSAAKLAGCRAIIQAGWAHLSLEALKSSTKDQSLIDYAEQNVLFIEAAPHEWLFPQCACAVHHGGAGTTAASLRAGTPTVITPIFLDQFDHSYMINRLGVGVGFKQQFQGVSAKELAAAVRRCLTSDDIRAKAKEFGLTLRSQDGARRVAEYVEEFWAEHVKTGRQLDAALKFQEQRQEKLQAPEMFCACLPRTRPSAKK